MREKALLILFGLVLGLVAGEIALRVVDTKRQGVEFESVDDFRQQLLSPKAQLTSENLKADGSISLAGLVNPHPDEHIIYDLKPNLTAKFASVSVTTNSCGLRGAERRFTKAPDTYRIALLGDSFAFGWGVEQKETFAQVMEDELNRVARGSRRFEVINFGVPGYSTFNEVELFREKGLDFQPDAVLLFFVHNDFDFPFFIHDQSKPIGIVSSFHLGRLGAKVLNPTLAAAKAQMRGIGPNHEIAELDDITRGQGIKFVIAINPRRDWERIQKRLSVLKERPWIAQLDLASGFDEMVARHGFTEAELDLPKDIHPSALRSRIYGELLAQYFFGEIPEEASAR